MKDLTPDRSTLDPIEIASRDEIEALQLDRLKWSLSHAYTNVPHYKAAFDAAEVHPGRPEIAQRSGEVSFHHQTGPARQLPVRHVRSAAQPSETHSCVLRHHGSAHCCGLYGK